MENMSGVSAERVTRESWKYYFVAAAWPVYLFLIPYLFMKLGAASFTFVIFPGAYLFTWTGFLMHESWHKYVPNVPNEFFYNLLSWMILTDPQVYKVVHGTHHAGVNSWEDREFHPLGKIENINLRRIYNLFEIFLGIGFISLISSITVPLNSQFRPKYRVSRLLISVLFCVLFIGGIGMLAHAALGVPLKLILPVFIANFWIDSLLLHHSQLIEHGNLIVPGEWKERNIKVRNLRPAGILEKLFLFLTHGDSREHVLHHTMVGVYSRPFPGQVPMPENAVYITLRDYAGILKDMVTEK